MRLLTRGGGGRRGYGIIALILLGGMCSSLLIACGGSGAAPTSSVGTVEDQLARGAPLYVQNCATSACHGTHGQGVREGSSFHAFPLVGKELQQRDPNAQVIFDVVRSGGEQNLRAMTDQQIYDAIAYELSQNGEQLTKPITGENAAATTTGQAATGPAAIYPPLSGIAFLTPVTKPGGSWSAAGDNVALRVDQIGETGAVGQARAPDGGTYVIIVFALQALAHPIAFAPQYLNLYDKAGRGHAPEPVALSWPIEQVHRLTVQPGHGTAAIAIYALAGGAHYDRLAYDDGAGHPVSIKLLP
jgi:mono/diheme cytochrome c family protein